MATKKPDFCSKCPITKVTEGYVQLKEGAQPHELWVGEASGEEEAQLGLPFVGGAGRWLNSLCAAAHINRENPSIINTIGCKPPNNVYPSNADFADAARKWAYEKLYRAEKVYGKGSPQAAEASELVTAATKLEPYHGREAVNYCYSHHLLPALRKRSWKKVVAIGDQALRATTTRQGILTWRGSSLPFVVRPSEGPRVVPIVHPSYLARESDLFSVTVRDLKRPTALPPERYSLYATLEQVAAFKAKKFAFDFEWDADGNITLCGLSDRYYWALVVTWVEPFITELRRIFENAEELIGHNIIGADTAHFEKLGWNVTAKLSDTMLMQHLIQPDLPHSLAFTASVFTNKTHWKGRGAESEDADGNSVATGAQWKTWNHPDAIPVKHGGYGGCVNDGEAFRLYNARDTDAEYQCYSSLNPLLDRYALRHTYENVSAPIAFICRKLGETGIKLNAEGLKVIRADLEAKMAATDSKLPEGLRSYTVVVQKQVDAPPDTYKPKVVKCKGSKKLSTSHEVVEVVFEQPATKPCPICAAPLSSGKMKELKKIKVPGEKVVVPWNSAPMVMEYAKQHNLKQVLHSKTGNATADKNARKVWGRSHTEFALVDDLKKSKTLHASFAKDALVDLDRIYFNLLPHGTSEGRLSSSGKRKGIDPNIQNQPSAIRNIYIPDDPEWCWLDADIVQGENMLTAWLAKDWERWERLNTPGFDEHSYMSSVFFNLPVEDCMKGGKSEELRKPGKVINHGRNYGLGVLKTVEYLAAQGFFYSVADVREMIELWKKVNARTAQWQDETIALAQRQTYLENPFGRRRWFQGRDFATKALAFLPASTLADTVLRMMIAHYPNGIAGVPGTSTYFRDAIHNLRLKVIGELPTPWAMRIQVHDSLVYQGHHTRLSDAAVVIKSIMTQPWAELGGFAFKVDMKASKPGCSWGSAKSYKP